MIGSSTAHPEPAGVGGTVQQHDRASGACDLVLDTDPGNVRPARLASLWPARGSAV